MTASVTPSALAGLLFVGLSVLAIALIPALDDELRRLTARRTTPSKHRTR